MKALGTFLMIVAFIIFIWVQVQLYAAFAAVAVAVGKSAEFGHDLYLGMLFFFLFWIVGAAIVKTSEQ